MLDRIIAEKWLTARGVAGLWPCRRDGDDVFVLREGELAPTPSSHATAEHESAAVPAPADRQARRAARTCAWPTSSIPAGDWIGGFAVGIHGIEPHLARFKAGHRRL